MEHDILYDETPVWKVFLWVVFKCRDNFQMGNIAESNRFADMSIKLEEIVKEFQNEDR